MSTLDLNAAKLTQLTASANRVKFLAFQWMPKNNDCWFIPCIYDARKPPATTTELNYYSYIDILDHDLDQKYSDIFGHQFLITLPTNTDQFRIISDSPVDLNESLTQNVYIMILNHENSSLIRKQEQLVSNITHAIRSPLNGILHLAKDRSDFSVENLTTCVNTLANNLLDLLDYTKIELGHLVLKMTNIRLQTIMEHICLVWPNLTYNISKSVPEQILTSDFALRQILTKILKFRQATKTHINFDAVYIADSDQYQLSIIIIDNAENLNNFPYEIFKNPEVTTDSILLKLCYELVKKLDGSINIYSTHIQINILIKEYYTSEPQKRCLLLTNRQLDLSKYHILQNKDCLISELPDIVISDQDDPIYEKYGVLWSYDGEFNAEQSRLISNVLIVDDEPINRLVIKKILVQLGFCKIDTAASGHEALDLYHQNRYNLVLLDIRMPQMDGFELADRIYEYDIHRGYRCPRLIGVTAQLITQTLKPWFNEFVYKPINIAELDALL